MGVKGINYLGQQKANQNKSEQQNGNYSETISC